MPKRKTPDDVRETVSSAVVALPRLEGDRTAIPSPAEVKRKLLEEVVVKCFHGKITPLETRRSGSLDFHEIAIWNLKDALEAAYEAGRASTLVT